MTKSRKVEILYNRAKGIRINTTQEELRELKPYKVDFGEGDFYATKTNISAYVSAVDGGCRSSFYDWCINNGRADRRRKGSSANEIRQTDNSRTLASMFMGWLTWGIAIYWIFHGAMEAGTCAIIGLIISAIIFVSARKWAGFTLIILPIILAMVFGG